MKTSHLAAVSAAVIAAGTLVSTRCLADPAAPSTIPTSPVGTLSAYPKVVPTGHKPDLTWKIVYPSTVSDVATINPPGTITITQNNTYVSVQIIGTGITACDSTSTAQYADARMSLNGGAYQQLFYGTQANVDSANRLYVKKLDVGDTINFSGRYVKNGAWSPLYTTRSSNLQVVTLVNGSTPATPSYQSPLLASYLKPYLSSTGKINIGPMSAIVLMELGQTNHGLSCFDYQDMVLLVTFSTKHPNNGHGNNLDGVDSSNPGNGHGGPNGMVDPSGGVDDEAN